MLRSDMDEATRFYVEVDHLLRALRTYLDMDVAFVSRFLDGRRIFQNVDCAPGKEFIRVGASDPLEESYCHWVVEGKLPKLMHDSARDPFASTLPVTAALPVGAHLGVPIQLESGDVYGTLCCFSLEADETLDEADVRVLEAFTRLIAKHISNVGWRSLADLVSHGADDTRPDKPRFRVLLSAMLVSSTNEQVVKLRNISAEGALIEASDLPSVGSDVFLRRGPCDVFASIAWREGTQAGLQFETPLSDERLLQVIKPPLISVPAVPPRESYRRPGLREASRLTDAELKAAARWAQP